MVVTLLVKGIPNFLDSNQVAYYLDKILDTDDVKTFRVREISTGNRKKIALDFRTGFEAMSAQEKLDNYTYEMPDGSQCILNARITKDADYTASRTPSPLRRTDMAVVPYALTPIVSYTRGDNNAPFEAELEFLKKQKMLLETKTNLLKANRKYKKECKKLVHGEELVKKKKKKKKSKKHRQHSDLSDSDSSDISYVKRKRKRRSSSSLTGDDLESKRKRSVSTSSRLSKSIIYVDDSDTDSGTQRKKSKKKKKQRRSVSVSSGEIVDSPSPERHDPKSDRREISTPRSDRHQISTSRSDRHQISTPRSDRHQISTPRSDRHEICTPRSERREISTPRSERYGPITPRMERYKPSTSRMDRSESRSRRPREEVDRRMSKERSQMIKKEAGRRPSDDVFVVAESRRRSSLESVRHYRHEEPREREQSTYRESRRFDERRYSDRPSTSRDYRDYDRPIKLEPVERPKSPPQSYEVHQIMNKATNIVFQDLETSIDNFCKKQHQKLKLQDRELVMERLKYIVDRRFEKITTKYPVDKYTTVAQAVYLYRRWQSKDDDDVIVNKLMTEVMEMSSGTVQPKLEDTPENIWTAVDEAFRGVEMDRVSDMEESDTEPPQINVRINIVQRTKKPKPNRQKSDNPKFVITIRILVREMKQLLNAYKENLEFLNKLKLILTKNLSDRLVEIVKDRQEYYNYAALKNLYRSHYPKDNDKELFEAVVGDINSEKYAALKWEDFVFKKGDRRNKNKSGDENNAVKVKTEPKDDTETQNKDENSANQNVNIKAEPTDSKDDVKRILSEIPPSNKDNANDKNKAPTDILKVAIKSEPIEIIESDEDFQDCVDIKTEPVDIQDSNTTNDSNMEPSQNTNAIKTEPNEGDTVKVKTEPQDTVNKNDDITNKNTNETQITNTVKTKEEQDGNDNDDVIIVTDDESVKIKTEPVEDKANVPNKPTNESIKETIKTEPRDTEVEDSNEAVTDINKVKQEPVEVSEIPNNAAKDSTKVKTEPKEVKQEIECIESDEEVRTNSFDSAKTYRIAEFQKSDDEVVCIEDNGTNNTKQQTVHKQTRRKKRSNSENTQKLDSKKQKNFEIIEIDSDADIQVDPNTNSNEEPKIVDSNIINCDPSESEITTASMDIDQVIEQTEESKKSEDMDVPEENAIEDKIDSNRPVQVNEQNIFKKPEQIKAPAEKIEDKIDSNKEQVNGQNKIDLNVSNENEEKIDSNVSNGIEQNKIDSNSTDENIRKEIAASLSSDNTDESIESIQQYMALIGKE